jgi:DUF4097 and DUF4098 domain-containing protein YvlB
LGVDGSKFIIMIIKTLLLGWLFWLFSVTTLLSQELVDRVQENFNGIETLVIKGAFCQTDIVVGSDSEVSLEGEIRSVRRYQDLRIRYEQNGTQLDVWIEHPRNTSGQLRGWLMFSVPAQTNVVVTSLSGSVSVDGLGGNSATLETLSGDVELTNCSAALKINTISGNINGMLLGGNVYAHSSSGNITLQEMQGESHLTSISGNVRVRSALNGVDLNSTSGNVSLSDVVGHAEVKSSSGNIAVSGLKGNAAVASSSGDIRIESVVGRLDLSTVSGAITGQEVMLTGHSNFQNGSGNIDVAFSNDEATLTYDLKTLSGRIEVYGHSADKQLKKGEGGIRVTGVTTSGNQNYR